jgi:DNA mismatch repair protein MutL
VRRINLLGEDTSNKIAAGEVVERPASVVKEIIENSIDAEAKNITIEIDDGGSGCIVVTDDGTGIHSEDIHKAFMTHGTSKIFEIEDLSSINTFGFRGEALPSIASVSRVKLKSRTVDAQFGKEIYIVGGKTEYIKDVGCNVGTSVEVKDLFFNVPARQKFLKSEQREASLISNLVSRLALANHNVSFKYYANNKRTLATYASNDVKETIRAIYGKNIYDNIIGFEKHSDIISVHGYIGNSDISRGSRNNQSIFVNRRFIKSGLITTAVENAFKSFLTINKHPFFVLFLDIYPEFIDVNVHPTKSEIKFEDERIIYKSVFDAVHKAIGESIKSSFQVQENYFDDSLVLENKEVNLQPTPVQIPIDLKDETQYINQQSKHLEFTESPTNSVKEKAENLTHDKNNYIDSKYNLSCEVTKEPIYYKDNEDINKTPQHINENENFQEAKFPLLNIIGQFNKTYILGENLGTFYMIDQHAAHEKILFEKFKKQIEDREVISQVLLTPLIMELNHIDFVCYSENINIFNETGFLTEDFGDNTISIREAPMLLGKVSVKEFFLEILDNIKNLGSGKVTEVKYNMIASLACKAAIKANHPLSFAEMASLIEELRYIDEPFNCPHGRPTIIRMSLTDIEKKFKRIQ